MTDANRPTDRTSISLRRRWIILRERVSWAVRKRIGAIGARAIRLGRWLCRKGSARCTWCGRECGFDSSISRKGLRCAGLYRDCQEMP